MKEPSDLKITTIYHKFPNVSSPFNFLHISDIHLEQPGIREKKLLQIVEDRKPDFILYTGDFLNLSNIRDDRAIENISSIFNQIHTIAPVYYVSGSPAVDVEDTIKIIEKNLKPIRLNNSNILLNHDGIHINIIGITCTHHPHLDIKHLPPLTQEGHINILLYHSPDLVYELKAEDKVDLMLSGHTHGGQVRLPIIGAIFTGSLYGRKLQKGLYQIHDTLLYISRGIGLEGLGAPRVRFLCSPEIIEWKINS
ncbi:MAG: metallophosphoesterase [Anaerolineaceae bacterium]|nr:metallophosphoesterase [Anaerolineaceae bacterium]